MSYAIIRNEKYTRSNLMGIYRHNERQNTSYTNKNINHSKSKENYSIKLCDNNYLKEFDRIKEENDLKGWIKKNSNVVCEYIITSDDEFFNSIGEEETKRYFETAYKFVANYKNLGEQFIISAKVHLDESTPHMHLVFIPVIHKLDSKSGKQIDKICCSDFWKGKDSYKRLQDNFYSYMIKSGFNLDRGQERENEHIPIEKLKQVTSYEVQELFKETKNLEQEVVSNDIEIVKENYKKVIKKFNTLAKRYTRIKNIVEETTYKIEQVQDENINLKQENIELENEVETLNNFIDKTFEYVSYLINIPKNTVKNMINNFVTEIKEFEKRKEKK
jgi:hypothetical protein